MNVIENEDQLRRTYQHLTRMYQMRDEALSEVAWHPEMRQSVADDTEAMIRSLEKQVAEFLQRRKTEAA